MSSLLAALVLFACSALAWSAGAQPLEPAVEAQRLAHLLAYIAGDYGGAVAGGVVRDDGEYKEQQSLLEEAAKIAARVQPSSSTSAIDVTADVARVRTAVDRKAPEADVAALVAATRADLVLAFKIADVPSSPPSAAHGKALYDEHCATCHGATGQGDTPRAASLTPHPANFRDPKFGEPLSPQRVATTVRFGLDGTAMIPFTFLYDADRWDLGFYVMGLRHTAPPAADSPAFALSELAARTDGELAAELRAAGIAEDRIEPMLSDLRRRAPYEDRVGQSTLGVARMKLERARAAITRGDRDAARAQIVDAYLEGIEPAEGPLRAADPALTRGLEDRFMRLRGDLSSGAPPGELHASIDAILRDLTRAESLVGAGRAGDSFTSTVVSSAGILLREGVEAALLIAALLGIAGQAGLADRKRWVHYGWMCALGVGALTWIASSRVIALSGARREMIEGVTALLATVVLFYVSYSLLAKREVARWMRFLKSQVTPRRAAVSLFGVALLAASREAFETVLFYQALLAASASRAAVMIGVAAGAGLLAALVAAYTRAGRFAPPQLFFKVSSWLLYGLAVVFAGEGVAALQVVGVAPLHPARLPSIGALGVYPTLETYGVQLTLLALAIGAAILNRKGAGETPAPRVAAAEPEPRG